MQNEYEDPLLCAVLHVRVDAEMYFDLKAEAARQGRRYGPLVRDIIRDYLAGKTEQS